MSLSILKENNKLPYYTVKIKVTFKSSFVRRFISFATVHANKVFHCLIMEAVNLLFIYTITAG